MNHNKNFLKELITSVKDFESYKYFIQNKISKSIIYILKLALLLCTIVCITIGYILIDFQKEVKRQVNSNITELKYSNSELYVNSNEYTKIEYNKFTKVEIIINTSDDVNVDEYYKELTGDSIAVILLKDRCIYVQNNQSVINYYKDLNISDIEFNKEDVLKIFEIDNIYLLDIIIIIFIYIFVLIFYFVSILIDSLLLSVLGILTSRILKMNISFTQMFNISVHSLTLSIILTMIYFIINIFTGFTIKYFQTMYIAIGYIYVITAILLLKSEYIDIIKEISKIEQEKENMQNNEKNKDEKTNNENNNIENNKNENNINNDEENNTKGEN